MMLHKAVQTGKIKVVKRLLDNGIDIDTRDNGGNTALHIAVFWGFAEIVNFLIDKGADINAVNRRGTTPLHIAARKKFGRIVERLIENGADLNISNQTRKKPRQDFCYQIYLKTKRWGATKAEAKKRANYKCQMCASSYRLNVHHKTYDRIGEEDIQNDLDVLCEDCHKRLHSRLKEEKLTNITQHLEKIALKRKMEYPFKK